MKRLVILLSFAIMLALLTSCMDKKSDVSFSYNSSETEEVEEEVKEAEKKPRLFYQRLLEVFCQRYYDSCFRGRKYHINSLIADQITVIHGNWEGNNIVSWNMMVKGRHSFEGSFKNHNDSPFEAFVDDIGNDNYEVTFFIKRYDIFGDQMDEQESATRTITYSE